MKDWENCLLVIYGEVALRGGNQQFFLRQMMEDIKERFPKDAGIVVESEPGRFLVRQPEGSLDMEYLIERVASVFGVYSVCPSIRSTDKSIKNMEEMAVFMMEGKEGAFKVVSRRADKAHPLKSIDISRALGAAIQKAYTQPVSMEENEHTLYVEVRQYVYIYSEIIYGCGGLPRNSAGKALSLLSGGIDSPVATYLTAKRGVEMAGVYFHSPPYTNERALLKVEDLAERLSYFTQEFELYIIDFTEVQLLLKEHVPLKSLTIMLKRSMLAIAEMIAKEIGAHALVTGDSIGQVASQTMPSLEASDRATDMMVIRPLAIFSKQEVVDVGIDIGTYDISIRPYDDCCTLFVANNPETKPKSHIIESNERHVPGLHEARKKAFENKEKKVFTFIP